MHPNTNPKNWQDHSKPGWLEATHVEYVGNDKTPSRDPIGNQRVKQVAGEVMKNAAKKIADEDRTDINAGPGNKVGVTPDLKQIPRHDVKPTKANEILKHSLAAFAKSIIDFFKNLGGKKELKVVKANALINSDVQTENKKERSAEEIKRDLENLELELTVHETIIANGLNFQDEEDIKDYRRTHTLSLVKQLGRLQEQIKKLDPNGVDDLTKKASLIENRLRVLDNSVDDAMVTIKDKDAAMPPFDRGMKTLLVLNKKVDRIENMVKDPKESLKNKKDLREDLIELKQQALQLLKLKLAKGQNIVHSQVGQLCGRIQDIISKDIDTL